MPTSREQTVDHPRRSAEHTRSNRGDRIDRAECPPILSASGRPIGVRVSYTVTVPTRGYFGITPSLYGGDARSQQLSLAVTRSTIDGTQDPTPFEPGKQHAMVVELYPAILSFQRDRRCVSPALSTAPTDPASTASPLRIMISETTYGNTYHGGREETTHGAYDVAELYRGVLAEGLPTCS